MFVLPDDLDGYTSGPTVFHYLHISNAENSNAKLSFSTHCLSIGINGIRKLITTEGVETFKEGDLIFYRPGNYLSYQHIDNDQPFKSLMIFFNPNAFSDVLNQLSKQFSLQQRTEYNKPYFSFQADAYIRQYSELIVQWQHTGENFTEALQKVKLLELICYLAAISRTDFLNAFNSGRWGVSNSQLVKVMEDNSNGDLSLGELAFLCNMSLATFKRSFVKNFGMSPGKWLQEKRLEWAARQIRAFRKPPKEVFLEAGYSDYSSFSYAFKQMYGVSPKKYSGID